MNHRAHVATEEAIEGAADFAIKVDRYQNVDPSVLQEILERKGYNVQQGKDTIESLEKRLMQLRRARASELIDDPLTDLLYGIERCGWKMFLERTEEVLLRRYDDWREEDCERTPPVYINEFGHLVPFDA